MGWLRVRALLVLPVLCLMIPTARADPEFRKTANLMVLSEALLTQSAVISEKFGKGLSYAAWSSSFSDRLWSADLSGSVSDKKDVLSLTGFAWGGDQDTLVITFSGTGTIDGEPVLVKGNATWIYDQQLNDYHSMDFQQVTRFGTGTDWFWSKGAETIVGGTLGGAAGVGLLILMKDTSPRDMFLALQKGADRGAAAVISLSKLVTGKGEGSALPEPPPMPARPAPQKDANIVPERNTVIVAISAGGQVIGDADNGKHVLEGDFSLEKGQAKGRIILPR